MVLRSIKLTAMLLLFVVSGCGVDVKDAQPTSTIYGTIVKWHDSSDGVTCWIFQGNRRGGISCIPDSQLKRGVGEADIPDELF